MDSPLRSKADRIEARSQVIPKEVRGIITRKKESGFNLPFLVWDISEQGLGLWTVNSLQDGEAVVITVGQPYLAVMTGIVVWCEEMTGRQGFRCGIEITDNREALAAMAKTFA